MKLLKETDKAIQVEIEAKAINPDQETTLIDWIPKSALLQDFKAGDTELVIKDWKLEEIRKIVKNRFNINFFNDKVRTFEIVGLSTVEEN
jgi:hypothetical protein